MSTPRSVLVFAVVGVPLALILGSSAISTADPALEPELAALNERVAVLERELSTLTSSVRSNHPDPALEQAAVRELQSIARLVAGGEPEAARPQLAAFLEEYGYTQAAAKGRSMQNELAAVGRPRPSEWKIEHWFQGEPDVDFQSPNPMMVVFWETWCPHCRREVPGLQQTFLQYKDRGFQILALTRLTRGATEESVRGFIEEHGLEFPVAREDGALSDHFAVAGIPAAAVLKEGRVIWRGHPALVSGALIESWLQ